MSAVGPGQLRARQRPLLILSIAGVRAASALCLAWPLASLVAASGIGARTQGDRALFEPGGYLLLEVVRLQGPALLAAARGLLPLLGMGLLLSALCNAGLLLGLNQSERIRASELTARALRVAPRLLLLGAGASLLQIVLGLIGAALAGTVPEPLAKPLAATLGQVAVWLAIGILVGAVGGLADVARASLIRHEVPLPQALAHASQLAWRRPALSCFGWLPYAFPLALSFALAARIAEACDVSQAGAWRVALVFVVHQLVIVIAVALRAAWYARALRLTASETLRQS
ncbi:MAG TPA: hypothetical protein VHB79_38570 [Polyangiaceae bacterium]|nr:hypothetical protein [Polyangiaceae bacterium]